MTEIKIDEGDKLWFVWPGRLGQGWKIIGPYELASFADEEAVLKELRKNGFTGMIYYNVAAPDGETALGHASEQFRADCQRRRDDADARHKAQLKEADAS